MYHQTVNIVKEKHLGISDTWTALMCGSSNALGRKYLTILNRGTVKVFFTADSDNKEEGSCRVLAPADTIILPYSDKVTVYAKTAGTVGTKLVITEEIG